MSQQTQEWDKFWRHHAPELQRPDDVIHTWGDVAWKVGLEFWHDRIVEHAQGPQMLECGCGSARLSEYMAQRGFQCTMLDNAEEALDIAKSRFAELALPGTFDVGDLASLPYGDNTFDVVFSGGVLHHFEDIAVPMREMVRVLKPGGMFAANVITKKFSCQSIGDFQMRCVDRMKKIAKWQFRERAHRGGMEEPFFVNSYSLQKYMNACNAQGLHSTVGLASCPFPNFRLPRFGRRAYASTLKRLVPLWKRFNERPARWKEVWGIGYNVYGFKSS